MANARNYLNRLNYMCINNAKENYNASSVTKDMQFDIFLCIPTTINVFLFPFNADFQTLFISNSS